MPTLDDRRLGDATAGNSRNTPITSTERPAKSHRFSGGLPSCRLVVRCATSLLARVRAVLRRVDGSTVPRYEDEHLQIDFADMRVVCDGEGVKLTRKEFALLAVLAKGAGRVALRQQLLDHVWGYQYFGDTRTLDVHIRRLRQKLGNCGSSIETVVGVGYRFAGCTNELQGEGRKEKGGS